MSRSEEGIAVFTAGCTCSQAVLTIFADRLGLEPEFCRRAALGFGGGIARLGMTCGAFSAAILILSLKFGSTECGDENARERTYAKIRDFHDLFSVRHGSPICNELLGCDINSPQGLARIKALNLRSRICMVLVKDTIEILETMLG